MTTRFTTHNLNDSYDIPSRTIHGSVATEFGYIKHVTVYNKPAACYDITVTAVDMFGDEVEDVKRNPLYTGTNPLVAVARMCNTLQCAQVGRADEAGL